MIPACLRTPIISRLQEAPSGKFAMKRLSLQYAWWPKIYREIQVHAENCIECAKAGKNLKLLIATSQIGKLLPLVEPNEDMELNFAGQQLCGEQKNTS